MFSGVGADDPVVTKTAPMTTETAIKVQNAAGLTMGMWGLAWAVGLYYLLRPSVK